MRELSITKTTYPHLINIISDDKPPNGETFSEMINSLEKLFCKNYNTENVLLFTTDQSDYCLKTGKILKNTYKKNGLYSAFIIIIIKKCINCHFSSKISFLYSTLLNPCFIFFIHFCLV